MKNKFMPFLITAFILISSLAVAEPIAIVIRARGKVTVFNAQTKKTTTVRIGTRLYAGSKVITKDRSFAALRFIDDKSLVRIRPNSSCTIEGKREKSGFFKNLFLDVGTVFAQIVKQRGVFQITTPTSVASVKGTKFWAKQEFKGGTYYFGEEGVVEISNEKGWALLHKGETGYVSSKNSRPIVRATKKGEKPEFEEGKSSVDDLEFEFKNNQGDTKSLRFKVKKQK